MAFTAHRAELLKAGPDGAAQREMLRASAKRGNVEAIKRLRWPRYPNALGYLDDWFHELSAARGETMSGLAPITHRDIDAWARLSRRRIAPHEARALVALDGTFRSALRGRKDEPASTPGEVAHADQVRPMWRDKREEV